MLPPPSKLPCRCWHFWAVLVWAGSILSSCDPSDRAQRFEGSPVAAGPPESGHLDAPVQHANPASILLNLRQDLQGAPLNGQPDHDFAQLALNYTHAALDLANLAVERGASDSVRVTYRQVRAIQEQRLVELVRFTAPAQPRPSVSRTDGPMPFGRAADTLQVELDRTREQLHGSSGSANDIAVAWQAYKCGTVRLARLELRDGQNPRLRALARQLLRPALDSLLL